MSRQSNISTDSSGNTNNDKSTVKVDKNSQATSQQPRKGRLNSVNKLNRILPVPIELDSRVADGSDLGHTCHITDVLVGDYHIISTGGTAKGTGSHDGDVSGGGPKVVVWAIRVILDDALYSSIVIYRRYSEIEKFRQRLIQEFPPDGSGNNAVPELPPKDPFSLQRVLMTDQWLESRRKGLQWFMTNALLNPKFQKSRVVTEFILSK